MSAIATVSRSAVQDQWLLTPAEAAKLRQEAVREARSPHAVPGLGEPQDLPMQVLLKDGPVVTVIQPDQKKMKSPIRVVLEFKPQPNGAAVDPTTLTLRGQMWVLGGYHGSMDLTANVEDQVLATGLEVRRKLPKGRYRFELHIRDVKGAESAGIVEIEIE